MIEGDILTINGIGKFSIKQEEGNLTLECLESDKIPQGDVLLQEKNIISMDSITSQVWKDQKSGDTLTFEGDKAKIESSSGSSVINSGNNTIVGDILYVPNIDNFLVNVDGESITLTGDSGSFFITEGAEDEALKKYALGERAVCDSFEVTLKEYSFAERIGTGNTTKLFERDKSWEAPDGKDMVFLICHFEYTNMSKKEIKMYWDANITVDYKGGFLYETQNGNGAYIFEDDINGVFHKYRMGDGYAMDLAPLQSGKFFSAIPVPQKVWDDETSSLRIIFDQDDETIVYQVR